MKKKRVTFAHGSMVTFLLEEVIGGAGFDVAREGILGT